MLSHADAGGNPWSLLDGLCSTFGLVKEGRCCTTMFFCSVPGYEDDLSLFLVEP